MRDHLYSDYQNTADDSLLFINLVACPYLQIIIYNPNMKYTILICEPNNQIPVIMEIKHQF